MTNVQKQFIKDFFMVLKAKLKAHNGKVIVATLLWPSVGVKPNTWKK
jgi:hypothetical protein